MEKKFYLVLVSGILVLFMFVGALLAKANPKEGSYNYLNIFSNVIHLIDSSYVDEVDFSKVMDSAVYGMVENLDSESFFVKGGDVESYRKEIEQLRGSSGVGLTLTKKFGMVMVIAVEKGSSAAEKKIKPGDLMRSINDQYVQSMPLYKIYGLLNGKPASTVKVSIFQSALEKPQDHTLVRKALSKPYTESYVAQPKIGYIRIAHLLPGVETEVKTKLSQFATQGVKSAILDLRGCTEEDQQTAIKVADLFIGNNQPIVQISGREGQPQKINSDPEVAFTGELLVLIDYTTAGGAEIIAGAIQDAGTGKTFGIRTFGRGGIQKLLPAGENYIMLTVQKYMTPKGRMILGNGIEPSIPFQETTKSAATSEDADRLLEKALEQLRHPATEKKAA